MADSPHTTYKRKVIRGREIQALADRLEARSASRLSTGSSDHQADLRLAAAALRALAHRDEILVDVAEGR
jgi:hypothetical protein